MTVIRRSATICTGCWQVVAIDGENNRERIGALCSHLAPTVEVVPSTDTPGAVSLDELLDLDVCQMAHEAYLHGDTQAALRTAFRAAIAKRGQ